MEFVACIRKSPNKHKDIIILQENKESAVCIAVLVSIRKKNQPLTEKDAYLSKVLCVLYEGRKRWSGTKRRVAIHGDAV